MRELWEGGRAWVWNGS